MEKMSVHQNDRQLLILCLCSIHIYRSSEFSLRVKKMKTLLTLFCHSLIRHPQIFDCGPQPVDRRGTAPAQCVSTEVPTEATRRYPQRPSWLP